MHLMLDLIAALAGWLQGAQMSRLPLMSVDSVVSAFMGPDGGRVTSACFNKIQQ